MIRLSTLFWLILSAATGFAMFAVKYEVQALTDQLTQVIRQAGAAEHDIRILDTEWAYLNRPDTLAQMNARYLGLVPIATKQLEQRIADLPMRPPPPAPPPPAPPPAPAATLVAVAAAAAMPSPATPAADPPRATAAASDHDHVTARPVALDRPAEASQSARPRPVKTAFRTVYQPQPAHRVRSLDALIAQIVESRQ
ncbi:MAG: cell division protein FtsL [Stellaceae bacterium]